MPLSPLSESESPLHNNTNGDTYVNPFEISDDISSPDPHTTIEPDDVDLSTPDTIKTQAKAKSPIPKSTTTINIEQTPIPVSGSIGQQPRPYASDTLDEPVSETILRDLRNVAIKLQQVLHPKGRDLWGPLILCLALAIMLSFAHKDQQVMVFTSVFVIVWCGSAIVTINAKLLRGTVSFFQSVCVLGYCIFPLVLVAFVNIFVSKIYIRLPLVIIAFGWSSYASVNFLSASHLANRRALAVYPLFLFYFVIGWMVLIS
ncbi:15152_t:CDS:2 [Funneliformis caledonium]|uniref:Protein YIP n=2 Tax=Funneliformis TaxID=1117308 RepID=A0A9N8Z5D6_9GLOM|nr:15152_t:CDS:2 [Funneliformis caledonium]CAG8503684.1 13387_t:CDS:2 [Funneliformis mosseae]